MKIFGVEVRGFRKPHTNRNPEPSDDLRQRANIVFAERDLLNRFVKQAKYYISSGDRDEAKHILQMIEDLVDNSNNYYLKRDAQGKMIQIKYAIDSGNTDISYDNPSNPLHPFSGFGGKSVEDFYRKFHYKQPKRKRYVELPDRPDAAFVIGRLVNLTYLPFGSSGKPHELHIHKFGDYGYKMNDKVNEMPLIIGDNKHNLFIARDRSKFFLDGRGIVG